MNASKRILLLLVTALMAVPAFSRKDVKIWKRIFSTSIKSMSNYSCIEAFIEDDNQQVSLYFLQDIGPVVVELSSLSGGVLASETINTSVTQSAEIFLEEPLPAGDYMISVKGETGEYYGVFSIE